MQTFRNKENFDPFSRPLQRLKILTTLVLSCFVIRRQSSSITIKTLYTTIWLVLIGNIHFIFAQNYDDLDIILVIGQSNMCGRATIEAEDLVLNNNIFLLDDTANWIIAENPLNLYSTVRKNDVQIQRLSLAWDFAKSLHAHDGRRIGIVMNARGATKMSQWVPGTTYYNEAVARVQAAIVAGGRIKGIIWHQGESDANTPSNVYVSQFTSMIEAYRNDLGVPNLPIIVGEIGRYFGSLIDGINATLAGLSTSIPHCDYASSLGLTDFDGIHFDSASTRIFGQRYAAKFIEVEDNINCVESTTAVNVLDQGGWSYYAATGTTDYVFAIEHTPSGSGSNTQTFSAEITLQENCNPNNFHEEVNPSTGEGIFAKGLFWNITITSGTLNGWVNLRWFHKSELEDYFELKATTYATTVGSQNVSSKIHFTASSGINLPTDLSSDGTGLDTAFAPLLNPTQGSFSGSSYWQYDQVSLSNGMGGSMLVKATNLNESNTNSNANATILTGAIRFNSTTGKLQGFDGTQWVDFH